MTKQMLMVFAIAIFLAALLSLSVFVKRPRDQRHPAIIGALVFVAICGIALFVYQFLK